MRWKGLLAGLVGGAVGATLALPLIAAVIVRVTAKVYELDFWLKVKAEYDLEMEEARQQHASDEDAFMEHIMLAEGRTIQ